MKEKTFEELIADNFRNDGLCVQMKVMAVMHQVREATSEEFCQALLGVNLPAETVKKIGKIVNTTDRIKTEK